MSQLTVQKTLPPAETGFQNSPSQSLITKEQFEWRPLQAEAMFCIATVTSTLGSGLLEHPAIERERELGALKYDIHQIEQRRRVLNIRISQQTSLMWFAALIFFAVLAIYPVAAIFVLPAPFYAYVLRRENKREDVVLRVFSHVMYGKVDKGQ